MKLIILLVLLVVIVIGGYFIWKTSLKPTEIYLHEGCKPTYKVEIGPELTASQNYAQLCYEKTRKQCPTVDIYNQQLNDFSKPDGLPDCEWGSLDSLQ